MKIPLNISYWSLWVVLEARPAFWGVWRLLLGSSQWDGMTNWGSPWSSSLPWTKSTKSEGGGSSSSVCVSLNVIIWFPWGRGWALVLCQSTQLEGNSISHIECWQKSCSIIWRSEVNIILSLQDKQPGHGDDIKKQASWVQWMHKVLWKPKRATDSLWAVFGEEAVIENSKRRWHWCCLWRRAESQQMAALTGKAVTEGLKIGFTWILFCCPNRTQVGSFV